MHTFKATDRYGTEMDFDIHDPSMAIDAEGEMQYRIAFSQAIKNGILTRDKMREVLKENGILGEEDDGNLNTAIREVAKLEARFAKAELASNDDEKTKIATELFKARQRMLQLFMVVNAAYTNSAEGMAELIKQEAVMAACTVTKVTGQRYWKSYKDYILERDGETKSTVVEKLHETYQKIMEAKSQEMLEDCPESKHLKTVSERILERAVAEAKEADATIGERVDESGALQPEADSTDASSSETSEVSVGADATEAGELDVQGTD